MAINSWESAQADRTRINVSDAKDLTHWAEAFGVSYTILHDLIRNVGTRIDDIDAELTKQRAAGSCTYIQSGPLVVESRLPSKCQPRNPGVPAWN